MVSRMKMNFHVLLAGLMMASLAGCEARYPFFAGPDTVIATDRDTGLDANPLPNGTGAIAYDPDGCQVWIVDDGIEGYATRRFDPATGKPICDGRYPAGTVLGDYETPKAGIPDRVPTRTRQSN
jgi:predicted small lipoprotein YifL